MTTHPLILVMGVSGTGKSTVGAGLAERLGVPFADADDLHPPANIAAMRAGIPLGDADREPWLDAVGAWLASCNDTGGVVACSALKAAYRDRLRAACPRVGFAHLAGDRDVIAGRQADRPGHFMPASLLDSQFDALEPLLPRERGQVVDVGQDVAAVVDAILRGPLIAGKAPGERR